MNRHPLGSVVPIATRLWNLWVLQIDCLTKRQRWGVIGPRPPRRTGVSACIEICLYRKWSEIEGEIAGETKSPRPRRRKIIAVSQVSLTLR
jgi:hypothetical protein